MKYKFISLALIALAGLPINITTGSVKAATVADSRQQQAGVIFNPADTSVKIDKVPNLDFGEVKVGTKAQLTSTDTDLQTEDFRNNGAGWSLYVNYDKASDQAWTNENSVTGKGFELNLPPLTYAAKSDNMNMETAPDPAKSAFVVNDAQTLVENAKASVFLEEGNIQIGMGNWTGSFDKSQTTLDIPTNNIGGNYSATLLWTMNNAPDATQ